MLTLANRLRADETTAGELVIEGFAPDHPGGKTVSRQHKFLISENILLDTPSFSFAKLKGNWSGWCHFISLKTIYCSYSFFAFSRTVATAS
jgi:hypothetical protein